MSSHRGAAAATTVASNRTAAAADWLADDRDDVEAGRGFLATTDPLTLRDERGHVVWDLTAYSFLDQDAPDTVHPSLWRMARLNRRHGLFRVTEHIYQVRGFDISNMTVILAENGYIVIDPLTTVETARAAMDLVRTQLGDRPVTGMLYTRSHIDHFGGAGGVIDGETATRIPVIAPEGFVHHAVVEHVNSGVAVSRRSQFMFGRRLPPGPRGQVSAGLGITLPSGRISLVEPNTIVERTGEELRIDGVRMVFQFTPGAEAPTEVNIHLPDLRALCMAETVAHHMHNLYTLRGAQVRDALAWSRYLDEAIQLFGDDTDVMFISHHWPVWGRQRVRERIAEQRDLYRYIHDQTLRLANHGLTPTEIADVLTLPPELDRAGNRGNYGSLSHNTKAVYQRYLGWYDANPANLDPLPPAELGRHYVAALGGPDAVCALAAEAVARGEFRWAADVLKHAIAAGPSHATARHLQADVFEQLGYRSESGPWRNFYLLAAAELRGDAPPAATFQASNAEMAHGMDMGLLLDFVAIRVNGPRAAGRSIHFTMCVTDRPDQDRQVRLERAVLWHGPVRIDAEGPCLIAAHETLARLSLGSLTLEGALASGEARIDGEAGPVQELFGLLDDFAGDFSITDPHAAP
ncbi:alkyl sulfatase dimerization domain-containing protein [Microbacterium horticulturae]|uniref:Alkyl sulfatase dimerization domain-containing protein n=1 Tax=Microbacterium horticulturae TaxID=3028316 RepID=A0ABY8BX04_9MICO|nr:alkyl sulfatase dimerization domain-containing protein [Microbacterium sp. KACC 23027]WEG08689.1 alkyl sulfatase dimerization domain-containing protein [Microbacterium sp. KACC 23027]